MTTFEEYKECAKKWYKENKSSKKCPSDKKLLEWFKDFSSNEKMKGEANNISITNKKGKNAKPKNLRTDEGTGLSKTVKNGVNVKTKNYEDRSPDFVRESEDDIDEGAGLSLTNKKGANSKPKNRKKRMNESQIRSYIQDRLGKLERLSEIAIQKKKFNEDLTVEDMKNLFMVIDANDQSLIGKTFMNPPEGTSYIPVRKDDSEAEDYGVAAEASNLPTGTEYDSNAPWNDNQEYSQGKISKKQLTLVDGDPKGEMLVQDESNYYVISKYALEDQTALYREIVAEYGDVPETYNGRDEDGDPDIDYDYDNAEFDTDDLLNAAGDYILRGDLGTPDQYASSEHFVYQLTPELGDQLWSHSSPLENNPIAQKFIDYDKLRAEYPHSF